MYVLVGPKSGDQMPDISNNAKFSLDVVSAIWSITSMLTNTDLLGLLHKQNCAS